MLPLGRPTATGNASPASTRSTKKAATKPPKVSTLEKRGKWARLKALEAVSGLAFGQKERVVRRQLG